MNEVHYSGPGAVDKPPKAFENLAFVRSEEGRAVRLLAEFLEPAARFKRYGIERAIVFFGSARILPLPAAIERLQQAERRGETTAIERAKMGVQLANYYEDAVKLAERFARWSMTLPAEKRFHLVSGGGPGIMEACNRGAHQAGQDSVGLNINIPWEQKANPYIAPHLQFEFHYFLMRKFWFSYLARAVIVFPGGMGTLDELFELATLLKTNRSAYMTPIVLFGSQYWREVFSLEAMLKYGTINEEEAALLHFSDDLDEAFHFIVNELQKKGLA